MANYKLPKCMLGQKRTGIGGDGMIHEEVITEADVNLKCRCENPMQAFFCMEGHMTECHVGMSCEEAECSHYESDEPFEENDCP